MNKHYKLLLAGAGFAAMMTASPVLAQDQETAQDEAQKRQASNGPPGKRGSAQNVQDVPIAITAFGSNELDSIHARSISSVSYAVPNASLESVGTTPGYANFSIRGLGINSSIPSIDPTVGVFVDGVYLGVSAGVLFDTFDLEGVEILRGPQGLLFGRNVTGGAVLLRTTTPSNRFRPDAL